MLLPDGRTATYTYDPFGRRIKKQVGGETTIFIYADEGLIGEFAADGTNRKAYGWRPNGIWGTNPVFQQENGQYYFYHNDHLGTPQSMTDAAGDIVWEATYEAFGKAAVDPDSTIINNLRFPGQYWDEETNLHYNWNRYYDPNSGRYVSKDPLGILKGRNHLFAYSQNNSINWIDPYGLLCTKATPAPSNLIGSCDYYKFRANDFVKRQGPIGKEQSYYMDYGYKYCMKFNTLGKQRLSKAGRDWIDATTRSLQLKLENELSKNSNIECCGLRKAAFASHPEAYMEGGLESLGIVDKVKIVDIVKDDFDYDAFKQMIITTIYLIGAIQQY